MQTSSGPLAGVRVVDFSHILAGPFCTQLLADAGADVIKVEPPSGEFSRIRGPRRSDHEMGSVSSYHAAINRGKRSIALDLKSPDGLELVHRLIATADVAIENFAPGGLRRLGVDFRELRERHPRLITVSISLYGSEEVAGPLATRSGLAIVAEAESSVTGVTRDRESQPVVSGLPLGDMASGFNAYGAIVTALFERQRTGVGRHVDVSMVRTLLSMNAVHVTGAQFSEIGNRPAGYGLFAARDGHVTIGVNSDSLFSRLATAMEMPELADDPRYRDHLARDQHADEVNTIIADWVGQFDTDEIVRRVSDVGVPCGKVRSPSNMLHDADLAPLGLMTTVDDGIGGVIETPANPMGFGSSPASLPRLAEHARDVLGEIGVGDEEFAELTRRGAFGNQRAAL